MVSGTGTQIYAEDVIGEMIQHKFDVLFDEAFWPQFLNWYTLTLDGTNGQSTTDLTSYIKRFEDIRVIYKEDTNTPLTVLSGTTTNPFELTGTSPLMYEADSEVDKVFHVWPKASTGNVIVQARTRPDAFTGEDTVNFDEQALILGACYDYAEDDGTNPNATQKFQGLFETRVKQLRHNLDRTPIALDSISLLPQTFGFTAL